MPTVIDFAAARAARHRVPTLRLPPQSAWDGGLLALPAGGSREAMPSDVALQGLSAFHDGFREAVGTTVCSVDGFILDVDPCLAWNELLAPLAVSACRCVSGLPGAEALFVEVFPAPSALTGWGVRGLGGPHALLNAAGYAVAMASRLPDGSMIILDPVIDLFRHVLAAHRLPAQALEDVGGRLLMWRSL